MKISFHGQLGFVNLRSHLLNRSEADLIFNFALDFTAKYADGTAVSEICPVAAAGEVLRQRIRLDGLPATVLRVRQPDWANAVTAVAADGSALPLVTRDGFCATARPVSEATFIYAGGIYAEDRHFKRLPAGPVAGEAGVIGYGPKLLAAQGLEPLPLRGAQLDRARSGREAEHRFPQCRYHPARPQRRRPVL